MRYPLITRYADYDSKGHANNAVYLTFFEVARHSLWRDTWQREADPPFIIGEARVKYASPARIGDLLVIDIRVAEIRTKAWVFRYEIRDASDERLIAEGETVQVMFDYVARSTRPIPEDVRQKLESIRV